MSSRGAIPRALTALLAALACLWWWSERGRLEPPVPARAQGLAGRLLGPGAGLAADVQWVRVHAAMRAGRTDLALARAETALALAPESSAGWLFLAHHLAFDRASKEREPEAARRRGWIAAGLEVARRGELASDAPAELAAWQGLVRVQKAGEPELDWPGGARALLEAAARDFARARDLGHRAGDELVRGAERRLSELIGP